MEIPGQLSGLVEIGSLEAFRGFSKLPAETFVPVPYEHPRKVTPRCVSIGEGTVTHRSSAAIDTFRREEHREERWEYRRSIVRVHTFVYTRFVHVQNEYKRSNRPRLTLFHHGVLHNCVCVCVCAVVGARLGQRVNLKRSLAGRGRGLCKAYTFFRHPVSRPLSIYLEAPSYSRASASNEPR